MLNKLLQKYAIGDKMNKVEYVNRAFTFVKNFNEQEFKNFLLSYLGAYSVRYNFFPSLTRMKPYTFKKESIKKLNQYLFLEYDEESDKNYSILTWLEKFPPLKTDEDVLGDIYLMYSQTEHRKKMGEHYTRTDLVDFVLENLKIDCDFKACKTIDPACGSGNFLINILRIIINSCSFAEKNSIINKFYDANLLVGVDVQDIPCLITSIRFLMELIKEKFDIQADKKLPVFQLDSLENLTICAFNEYDLVVTNPPFLRYQQIDNKKRDKYKEQYTSATGHFDTYVLFVEKCIKMAKQNGEIVILTSDKFMTAAYGKGIRKFIENNVRLDKVYDLRNLDTFEAMVLSAIYFFTKRNKSKNKAKYNSLSYNKSKNKIVKKHMGYVNTIDRWRYTKQVNEDIIRKIYHLKGVKQLANIDCRISVGIQTTADKVFSSCINKNIFIKYNIEKELIKPILRGKNISKWDIKTPDNIVLYPYINKEKKPIRIDLHNYPNTKKYLLFHYDLLSARSYIKGNKLWYEHLTPKSYDIMEGVKIITPDLASENTFALDTQGLFCNGTTYFIKYNETRSLDDYKYLLAILNSEVINFIHKSLNTVHLASEKYRFQAQYMGKYPIKLISSHSNEYKKIIKLVNIIIDNKGEKKSIEEKLNNIIYKLYYLNEKEIKIINSFTKNSK